MPRLINPRIIATELYTPNVTEPLNHQAGSLFNKSSAFRIEKHHKLELLLHNVLQLESNDNFLQGTNDEVYAWQGVAIRSDKMMQDANNQIIPLAQNFSVQSIENKDLAAPYDPGPEAAPSYPVTIYSFDLENTLKTNAYFSITLFVIEGDNGNLGDSLKEYAKLGIDAIKAKASAIAEEVFGNVGGAIGGAIGGPMGAIIGKVVIGKLIALGIDEVVNLIVEGLNDDKLKPFVFNLLIDEDNLIDLYGSSPIISSGIKNMDYRDGSAHYTVSSEWKLHREVKTFHLNINATYRSSNEHKANEMEITIPPSISRKCAGEGITCRIWSINRDMRYDFTVTASDNIPEFAWYIDGNQLINDGVIRGISLNKEIETDKEFNYLKKNIQIEYSTSSYTNLVITTKSIDGNFPLDIKLVCLGKQVLHETLLIRSQDFTGDEAFKKYRNCVIGELQYKESLSPLPFTIDDFVPEKNPVPFEKFGILSDTINIDRKIPASIDIKNFRHPL